MAQNGQEDAPFGIFRVAYSIFAWTSLAGTAAVLVYLMVTMFINTPPGTATAQQKAEISATLEASSRPTHDPSAPAVVALPASCAGCHTISGTAAGGVTCPDLTLMGSVAEERIASSDYSGSATTAEEYIRESIVDPSAHIVQGPNYEIAGNSLMPANSLDVSGLDDAGLDELVAYLASLR